MILDQLAQEYKEASESWQRLWLKVLESKEQAERDLESTRQQWDTERLALEKQRDDFLDLIFSIQSALNTEEMGDKLVAAAKEAHESEVTLNANLERFANDR